ncbi:MAG TPA: DoxX family protein [Kofleriaceae bacterium]|nr:DoxX family protein [Kofleriaceae bacterium]
MCYRGGARHRTRSSHMTDRARLQSLAGAALRIVAGAMFALHGAQRILGGGGPPAGSQPWIAQLIALVCGGLVALGLFTRPAALVASATMAIAYLFGKLAIPHWHFLPTVSSSELTLLYCFVFLVFGLSGAGALSIDGMRGRR